MENKLQKILSKVRRAVDDYGMINNGDRIAVGISGGKDSLTLLYALAELRRFYPAHFDVIGVSLDMGHPNVSFAEVRKLCEELNVEYIVKKTDIAEIIFDIRKEKNPCSLCAKMRRGGVNDLAVELGCNKVALGHHREDVIETFFLSLFYEGRINCFSPVTYLSRRDIYVIRPLLYMPEGDIKSFAASQRLPVVPSNCPIDGHSKRQDMKDFINQKSREDKFFKTKIMHAIINGLPSWNKSENGQLNKYE